MNYSFDEVLGKNMIKNELLKSILTKTIFKVFSIINKVVPKDDKMILLYTNMGFRDNIEAIYDYLIENEFYKKYRILISSNEPILEILPDNIKVISNIKGVKAYLRAAHVFYAFGRIPIYPAKNQYVVQMWHGTPFKAADEHQLKTVPKKPYYTSMLISSDYFKTIVKRAHGLKDENIAICGQPRTDIMFKNKGKYNELMGYEKVIIWMPTFRKSKVLGYSDVGNEHSVVPVVNVNNYEELNSWLKSKNVLLIVKLHPMEDALRFQSMDLSNLMLLSHKAFNEKKWDLYRTISQCDAMITDYSSVFYDFMLLDRPLAFTADDYEEYQNGRGFAVDDPDYLTAGYKIHNEDQLKNFIKDLLAGVDLFKKQRNEVNKLVNTFNDGKQCERALRIANILIKED